MDRHGLFDAYHRKWLKLEENYSKISNVEDNFKLSYLAVSYKDKAGADKNAYFYVYEQELPEEWQAYMKVPNYGNLIIKIDSSEMDRLTSDRSTALDLTKVQEVYTSLVNNEVLKAEVTDSYGEKHTWMGL